MCRSSQLLNLFPCEAERASGLVLGDRKCFDLLLDHLCVSISTDLIASINSRLSEFSQHLEKHPDLFLKSDPLCLRHLCAQHDRAAPDRSGGRKVRIAEMICHHKGHRGRRRITYKPQHPDTVIPSALSQTCPCAHRKMHAPSAKTLSSKVSWLSVLLYLLSQCCCVIINLVFIQVSGFVFQILILFPHRPQSVLLTNRDSDHVSLWQ